MVQERGSGPLLRDFDRVVPAGTHLSILLG